MLKNLKLETLTKFKKKKIPLTLVFLEMRIKEKHPIYMSKKCCEEKQVDLSLIGQEGKRHYVLIKGNTFL